MADAWVSRRETAAYHQVKIYCSICGVLIEPDMVDAIFTELSKECQHSKNALYCTTANLETRYFEGINGCAWTSLFRLIIKDHSTDPPTYRLSGIAQHNLRKEPDFLVPVNQDQAVIGLPTSHPRMKRLESVVLAEDLQTTTYYMDKELKHSIRFGYPVHARCWSLCGRVIGPDIERHLERFLDALRQQFRKRINPRRDLGWDGWFASGGRHWFISTWTRFLHRDPVKIPAVDDFIESTIIRTKNPRCYWEDGHRGDHLRQTTFGYPFEKFLPYEVQCLIWNYFDHKDATILHQAFTGKFQWHMPDSYWIFRAKSTRIFEIQDVFVKVISDGPNKYLVNWESLCLQAEELVHTCEELRNRRRIMQILERTKKHFYTIWVNGRASGEGDYGGNEDKSECPEHGYDGFCRDGLSPGSSIYEDEDDMYGLDYKDKALGLDRFKIGRRYEPPDV